MIEYFCVYTGCSKSTRPLVGKNTFTSLEVCNPNALQSSLLVTEHTSPSGSAIVHSISGMPLCEWSTAWPSCSVQCRLVTQIESLSAVFSGGGTANNCKQPYRESREPVKAQECFVWPRKFESVARNELVLRHEFRGHSRQGQIIGQNGMYRTSAYPHLRRKFSDGDTMVLNDQSPHLDNEPIILAC